MVCLRSSAVAALLASTSLHAAITLPDVIADHMVVQRDREIPVWGQAAPDAEITVTMNDKTATAKAGTDGAWEVKLPALSAGGPHQIKITGDGESTIKDVLVGDVWLSSGQSNLTFRMVPNLPWSEGVLDYEKEVASANNPKLRFFSVTPGASHKVENEAYGIWQTVNPNDIRFISAVSYYFGKELQETTGIPIGIIVSGRGGTSIKSWLPRESIEKYPELKTAISTADGRLKKAGDAVEANLPKVAEYQQKYRAALLSTGKVPSFPDPYPHYDTAPSALYNAMIAPLAKVPITGFIYYQGESDSQGSATYTAYFKDLIQNRRALWNLPEAPFLFVQLANYDVEKARKAEPGAYGPIWARQRLSQAGALELPRTAMAVAADVGDEVFVHPRDKKTVGHRLALAGRHLSYGEDVPFRGPLLESAVVKDGSVALIFSVEKGQLAAKGELAGFELAGADGQYEPAQATLAGNEVRLTAASIASPTKVRYAFANNPTLCLYDSNGLPCPPFEKEVSGQ